MTIQTTTHLNFRGDARAALAFYQLVFGGQQIIVTYSDVHAVQNPAEADQVMWGQVASDNGFRVMAYDVPSSQNWNPGEIPLFLSVRGNSADELSAYWAALAEGATILAPLAPSGWAPLYGMLKDRFGVTWVLDIEAPYAG